MKKFFAIVLALVLTLSLTVGVFAEDPTYSITVKNEKESISIIGNTYYAYKLFDVIYADTDADGKNDAYTYTINESNQFFEFVKDLADDDKYFKLEETTTAGVWNVSPLAGYDARAFANEIQGQLKTATPDGSEQATTETVTIAVPSDGYYIVAGTATAPENQTITAAVGLTTAEPTAEIEAKADAPSIDKFIVNSDAPIEGRSNNEGKGTAQDVGSVVEFVSYSAVPDMTGYTTYEFKIHDTMSAGLTFTNTVDYPVTVKIGDKTLKAGEDYVLTTGCTDGCDFEIYIADMTKYTTGDKIVVTYYATINEGALNTSVETNEIYLEYSNNPYTKGTGETPKHIVYVYDFDIVIDKYANITEEGETVKNPLAGAKFVLRNADGDYYYWNATTKKVEWYKLAEKETIEAALAAGKPITVVETDANGWAHFEGLDSGTYYLHETKAPKGYNLLLTDPEVTITATYDTDGTLKETNTTLNTAKTKYEWTESIENKTGTVLPSTGGIGTKIFYVAGSLLVVAAVVLLITRKRMSNNG